MNRTDLIARVAERTEGSKADAAKYVNAMLGVIVLAVCLLIVFGIQNNMRRISGKLGEVAQGNLTVQVKAKGRDEFRGLADRGFHNARGSHGG